MGLYGGGELRFSAVRLVCYPLVSAMSRVAHAASIIVGGLCLYRNMEV